MKIHLFNLPSVDQYVNQLISSYITIQTDFRQGDILLADKINHLRQKSRYMIRNIDSFMNKNALDPRVGYLYSTRNKLAKFLFKIDENALVRNVNEINHKQGVQQQSAQQPIYQTPISKKSPQLPSFRQNQNNQAYLNESAVIIQTHGQQEQYEQGDQLLQQRQFSQVKQFALNNSQQKGLSSGQSNNTKQRYFPGSNNNLSFNVGYDRMEGKVKMGQNEIGRNHKKQISELYQPRQKSRTPNKTTTSRKTQLFNPRQNVVSRQQQQQDNAMQIKGSVTKRLQYDKKPQTTIHPHQQPPQKSHTKTLSNYQQRTKPTLDHIIQKTSSKSRVGIPSNSSNMKNTYEGFGNINRSNIENTFEKDKQQVQFTPIKQQHTVSNAPSSAMRSLANLIFTIKMTKQEYNEFKRIKEQHQGGKQSYIQ